MTVQKNPNGYLRGLELVQLNEGEIFGGKCVTLGALKQANFPVVDGVCVSKQLFLDCMQSLGLGSEVSKLETLEGKGLEEWRKCFSSIETTLASSKVNEWLTKYVRASSLELFLSTHKTLVVRSSTVSEDGISDSYAGVFESILHVTTVEKFADAIRLVWASAFNVSTIDYVFARTGKGKIPEIGILVQPQILPILSGVAFTMDPVSSDLNQLIIQGSKLGSDAITGGTDSGIEVRVWYKDGKMAADRENGDLLDAHNLRLLVDLCKKIEIFFGRPQDIEWAVTAEATYIFQSRPVTKISDEALMANGYEQFYAKTRLGKEICGPMAFPPLARDFELNKLNHCEKEFVSKYYGIAHIAPFFENVQGFFYINKNVRQAYSNWKSSPYRASWYHRIDWILRFESWFSFFWAKGKIQTARASFSQIAEDMDLILKKPSDVERASELVKIYDRLEKLAHHQSFLNQTYLVFYDESFSRFHKTINSALKRYVNPREIVDRVAERMGHFESPYSFMGETANLVRQNPLLKKKVSELTGKALEQWISSSSEAEPLRRRLQEFELEFGHSSSVNTNLALASWKENLSDVIETIKTLCEKEPKNSAHHEKPTRRGFGSGLFKIYSHWTLQRLASSSVAREQLRNTWERPQRKCREVMLKLGNIFADQQILSSPADIFYMRISEMRWAGLNLERAKKKGLVDLVERRKKSFESILTKQSPDEFTHYFEGVLVSGFSGVQAGENVGDIIAGTPVCKGIVTAPVWLMPQPDLTKPPPNPKDYIFVLPYLDRGSWPWLMTAKGLIIDRGSILSHGAILARELNIPAIVDTKVALGSLSNEKIVTLDGSTGRIALTVSDDKQAKVS